MKIDTKIKKRFSELEIELSQLQTKVKSGDNFDALFSKWGTNVLNLLDDVFPDNSVHRKSFHSQYDFHNLPAANFSFSKAKGIFLAAKEDYENGYLSSFRSLLKAEFLTEDILTQAEELLNAGYKDPGCVLVGVALETAIKELCTQHGIGHKKLDQMNSELRKAGVYNLAKQKQVTAWADLRNKAAHGDWSEYSMADVNDFFSGVQRFIGDFL